MGRRVPGGIELKCRRCRRHVVLMWRADGQIATSDPEGADHE